MDYDSTYELIYYLATPEPSTDIVYLKRISTLILKLFLETSRKIACNSSTIRNAPVALAQEGD